MRSMDAWLESEETGGPFKCCVECRLPLVEIDAPWLVNKDYFRGECVLEYAICQPCRDQVAGCISEESKAAVRRFLETAIDWNSRVAEFMLMEDPTERFCACISCRRERDGLERFSISALFDSGGFLTSGALPLLMCHECVAKMTAQLSAASRAVWKSFLARHFAGPSGDDDDPFGDLGLF